MNKLAAGQIAQEYYKLGQDMALEKLANKYKQMSNLAKGVKSITSKMPGEAVRAQSLIANQAHPLADTTVRAMPGANRIAGIKNPYSKVTPAPVLHKKFNFLFPTAERAKDYGMKPEAFAERLSRFEAHPKGDGRLWNDFIRTNNIDPISAQKYLNSDSLRQYTANADWLKGIPLSEARLRQAEGLRRTAEANAAFDRIMGPGLRRQR